MDITILFIGFTFLFIGVTILFIGVFILFIGVTIQQLTFAGLQHSSAFTSKPFDKGHMFGPFQGKNVYTSEIKTNDGNSSMWEVTKLIFF